MIKCKQMSLTLQPEVMERLENLARSSGIGKSPFVAMLIDKENRERERK